MSSDLPSGIRWDAAIADLLALYRRLDGDIGRFARRCRADGECCRFGSDRPMLYLTALEAAAMIAAGCHIGSSAAGAFSPAAPSACPFLDGDICGIRERRAIGCRTFFCDPTLEEERRAIHERYLREIRNIEARMGIPVFYLPLHEALDAVGNILAGK
ncbi:MAG: hypothetical protein N3A38_08245 [Planctomycetota bacterium]|nr:hypothetical protein [Planctomycetota bacterium]